jgi:hypothetical protein
VNLHNIAPGILAGMLEALAITDDARAELLMEAARRLKTLPNYGGAPTIPDELRRNGSPDDIIALLTEQNLQLRNALRLSTDAHTP